MDNITGSRFVLSHPARRTSKYVVILNYNNFGLKGKTTGFYVTMTCYLFLLK